MSTPSPTLFDRKLKLIERLSCRELFDQLDQYDADIEVNLRTRNDTDHDLAVAQAQLAEAEALIALNVDGKNESERRARKAQLLQKDPMYVTALNTVRALEHRRAEIDATIDALKRKARRIEREIEYKIAIMHMLGGS